MAESWPTLATIDPIYKCLLWSTCTPFILRWNDLWRGQSDRLFLCLKCIHCIGITMDTFKRAMDIPMTTMKKEDIAEFLRRSSKLLTHELGHLYVLDH